MIIVGVTDEQAPAAKIKSYIEDKGIKYVIAYKGGKGYTSSGIPHSWLVSPAGKIVWRGHPASLKEPVILQNLKGIFMKPTFKLPSKLKKAEVYLNNGRFADGIKELERYLKKPASDEGEKAAKDTIKKVNAYGKEKSERADKLIKEREYVEAMDILTSLEANFKGMDVGKAAKAKRSDLKKNKEAKAEFAAHSLFEKAMAYKKKGKTKSVVSYLKKIVRTKKYAETKTKIKAEEELNKM